jgi:hypothetical protein
VDPQGIIDKYTVFSYNIFPLSEVYLIYTKCRKRVVLPSAGKRNIVKPVVFDLMHPTS